MQDQKIEKIAVVAVNITKVLVIIYLGFVEVFQIGKLLREKLDAEFDISRKWASQNYSTLKRRLAKRKVAGVIEN
jgi:Fe2+ transport system protein B